MPDASKSRRFDEFMPSAGMIPPDLPRPTEPLSAPATSRRLSAAELEHLEQVRVARKRRSEERAQEAVAAHYQQQQALTRAKKDAFNDGILAGELAGETRGWYWGMAFGLMLGCGLTYFALRVGFWWGLA